MGFGISCSSCPWCRQYTRVWNISVWGHRYVSTVTLWALVMLLRRKMWKKCPCNIRNQSLGSRVGGSERVRQHGLFVKRSVQHFALRRRRSWAVGGSYLCIFVCELVSGCAPPCVYDFEMLAHITSLICGLLQSFPTGYAGFLWARTISCTVCFCFSHMQWKVSLWHQQSHTTNWVNSMKCDKMWHFRYMHRHKHISHTMFLP